MSDSRNHWNQRYVSGDTPWDSGRPSAELLRVLAEWGIGPCRVLELGCGTGVNAVYLAQRGFDVTALDVAPLAVEAAKARANAAGVKVKFFVADVLQLPDVGDFPLVFDRGLYHAVRRGQLDGFLQAFGPRYQIGRLVPDAGRQRQRPTGR